MDNKQIAVTLRTGQATSGRWRQRVLALALFCLLLPGALMSARGELVLANFSAAKPVKIMAIGDSITDDCVFNGAWRQYLQPLLETNGYPFTFVGRVQSVPSGSFTKTQHEGYCGAVVAPPGVLTTAPWWPRPACSPTR